MSYASVHGHTLVDRRLYIMSQWFEDAAEGRKKRAAIPSDVKFKTKIELAVEMLDKAHKTGNLSKTWGSGIVSRYIVTPMSGRMTRPGKCRWFRKKDEGEDRNFRNQQKDL